MLTVNSVKIAIPVRLRSNVINSLFTDTFEDKLFIKSIIPDIFVKTKISIKAPAIREIYIVNSGLYCLRIIIKISAISPIPYNLYNLQNILLSFFKD